MDPYASCTCGSGKKFKWCCQPIQEEISQVFALLEQGQAEAATRAMDEVTSRHADNPQVWGQKAQMQYLVGQHEEAEKTLDKAFELFPTYPFGFFLKATFRMNEGEIPGALMLLRKAAELYDPNATDLLAQIHVDIFNCEMKLNHPVAARASLELAARFHPANEDIRKGLQTIFETENPNLPASARRAYHFKAPPNATPEQRHAWENVLKTPGAAKLSQAAQRFEQLTLADDADVAAWYNLALCQAWLGNNAKAVAALERYVSLETDEQQAAQAWALAEVLRLGQGMEEQADIVVHAVAFGLADPKRFVTALGELEQQGLLTGARVDEEQGVLSAVILEPPPPALTAELQAKQSLRAAAYLIMMGNAARLWNTSQELVQATFTGLQQKLGGVIGQSQAQREPAKFVDVLTDALRIPRNATTQEEALVRMREGFEKHFEEQWIHRPLKSLAGTPPIDASGHTNLRKKLRGIVRFIRECAEMTKNPYDFDRLERKLGLLDAAPTPVTAMADGAAKIDVAALGAAELASLNTDSLSAGDLDLAYQAALKLDARELAGKFAGILVEKPAYPERPDRFPLYQLLIAQATAQSNLDDALEYVNDGERDDCENNEGKRRNEYELRRAQLHAKRGEHDDAERVYDALIARAPTQLEYRVNAAETMLSARQGPKALKYAKEGAAAAVKAQNRDLEGHFKELMEAAQRH